MSERGSFVTEYIYCQKCLEAAKLALLDNEKYLCSQQIKTWEEVGDYLPIIAGKLGGLYTGEEVKTLIDTLKQSNQKPCHDVRIAVICDGIPKVFTVTWEAAKES